MGLNRFCLMVLELFVGIMFLYSFMDGADYWQGALSVALLWHASTFAIKHNERHAW